MKPGDRVRQTKGQARHIGRLGTVIAPDVGFGFAFCEVHWDGNKRPCWWSVYEIEVVA